MEHLCEVLERLDDPESFGVSKRRGAYRSSPESMCIRFGRKPDSALHDEMSRPLRRTSRRARSWCSDRGSDMACLVGRPTSGADCIGTRAPRTSFGSSPQPRNSARTSSRSCRVTSDGAASSDTHTERRSHTPNATARRGLTGRAGRRGVRRCGGGAARRAPRTSPQRRRCRARASPARASQRATRGSPARTSASAR